MTSSDEIFFTLSTLEAKLPGYRGQLTAVREYIGELEREKKLLKTIINVSLETQDILSMRNKELLNR